MNSNNFTIEEIGNNRWKVCDEIIYAPNAKTTIKRAKMEKMELQSTIVGNTNFSIQQGSKQNGQKNM